MVAVFDSYSFRAKQVLFLARLESGARGAESIDLDDLLAALVIEDQNDIPSTLGGLFGPGTLMALPQHQPFLRAEVATKLLEGIRESLRPSQRIPHSVDMPLSSSLREAFAAANELAKTLESTEVALQHLLAVLMRGSHPRLKVLGDLGITEEEVLKAIRNDEQK